MNMIKHCAILLLAMCVFGLQQAFSAGENPPEGSEDKCEPCQTDWDPYTEEFLTKLPLGSEPIDCENCEEPPRPGSLSKSKTLDDSPNGGKVRGLSAELGGGGGGGGSVDNGGGGSGGGAGGGGEAGCGCDGKGGELAHGDIFAKETDDGGKECFTCCDGQGVDTPCPDEDDICGWYNADESRIPRPKPKNPFEFPKTPYGFVACHNGVKVGCLVDSQTQNWSDAAKECANKHEQTHINDNNAECGPDQECGGGNTLGGKGATPDEKKENRKKGECAAYKAQWDCAQEKFANGEVGLDWGLYSLSDKAEDYLCEGENECSQQCDDIK